MTEGMTLKQVAQFCDVSEYTLRRWSKWEPKPGSMAGDRAKLADARAKMDEGQRTKKPAHLSKEEIGAILRTGGRPGLAALLEENASRVNQAPSQIVDYKAIGEAVAAALLPAVRVMIEESKIPERRPPELPPGVTERQELRRRINALVRETGVTHRFMWGALYYELRETQGVDLEARARNRRMKTLDFAEREGFLHQLLLLAKHGGLGKAALNYRLKQMSDGG